MSGETGMQLHIMSALTQNCLEKCEELILTDVLERRLQSKDLHKDFKMANSSTVRFGFPPWNKMESYTFCVHCVFL